MILGVPAGNPQTRQRSRPGVVTDQCQQQTTVSTGVAEPTHQDRGSQLHKNQPRLLWSPWNISTRMQTGMITVSQQGIPTAEVRHAWSHSTNIAYQQQHSSSHDHNQLRSIVLTSAQHTCIPIPHINSKIQTPLSSQCAKMCGLCSRGEPVISVSKAGADIQWLA